MIYVTIWVCNQKEPYLLVPNYYFIPTVCSSLVNVITYSYNTKLRLLYSLYLERSLPGHLKSLGGPKMARGPRVGRP